MSDFIHQRCSNHQLREAAARCPACSRSFCRECVTEHKGRVLCSDCIIKEQRTAKTKIKYGSTVAHIALFLGGILTVWFLFYYTGQTLLALPDSFHDGTLWQKGLHLK